MRKVWHRSSWTDGLFINSCYTQLNTNSINVIIITTTKLNELVKTFSCKKGISKSIFFDQIFALEINNFINFPVCTQTLLFL